MFSLPQNCCSPYWGISKLINNSLLYLLTGRAIMQQLCPQGYLLQPNFETSCLERAPDEETAIKDSGHSLNTESLIKLSSCIASHLFQKGSTFGILFSLWKFQIYLIAIAKFPFLFLFFFLLSLNTITRLLGLFQMFYFEKKEINKQINKSEQSYYSGLAMYFCIFGWLFKTVDYN